jgi:outer membrane receptor protein involved in Fe transport
MGGNRCCTIAMCLVFASSAVGSAVRGQTVVARVAEPRVTVRMDNVSIPAALEKIAAVAKLQMFYDWGAFSANTRVSVNVQNVPVTEAFAAALRGTGFGAVVSSTRKVIIGRLDDASRAHSGIVTGTVIDEKTGRPLASVNVLVDRETRGIITRDDGVYRLRALAKGSYTITARRLGYVHQTRTVTVDDGATVTIDFKLSPSVNALGQVVVTGTVIPTELKAVPNAITVITAKQIEQRGITKIDQLFRGDVPGLFAQNQGSYAFLGEVTMFSRGATALDPTSQNTQFGITNPIKTYVDGVELADARYLSQIDPKSIERIEILTGPQASTIYGSNAINGVMQVFTKRGSTSRPQLTLSLLSGFVENNFSSARTPQHDYSANLSGIEGRLSYNAGGSWNYIGPWTPAQQLTRMGSFGGARLDLPTPAGRVSADLSLRRNLTRSLQRGSFRQTWKAYQETGLWTNDISEFGADRPSTRTLSGQTLGLTLSYAPTSWWSHELGSGQDVSDEERRVTARGYTSIADTMLALEPYHRERRSVRYATTAHIPIASLAQLTLTTGADGWQSLASYIYASPQTLTGSLGNVGNLYRQPAHNTGGFLQFQLGLIDRLFLTYGVRMEKNPTIGDKASVIPGRYGAAYTQEFGALTAKLRGSYGRSIRPPGPGLKDAVPSSSPSLISFYGPHDDPLGNPDLTPEYQQGGEGGLELYLGNRGSLVITRYNQTVDGLISSVTGADSIRSLQPYPLFFGVYTCDDIKSFNLPFYCSSQDAQGYTYGWLSKNLNLGSIRNQGWELQGSVNLGSFTTRGTYSWTKSRTIGIDPRYRAFFKPRDYPQYQPGATFRYLPEHTWALGVTYARAATSVGLNVMGTGRATNYRDDFFQRNLTGGIRLQQDRFIVSGGDFASGYISSNAPYALADLSASHRFSSRGEAVLQVQNLTDYYINDFDGVGASIGRQLKIGLRVRTN